MIRLFETLYGNIQGKQPILTDNKDGDIYWIPRVILKLHDIGQYVGARIDK